MNGQGLNKMMKQIPTEFKKNGLTHRLIARTLHTALYEQLDGKEVVYGYEVHKVRHMRRRAVNKRILAACERLASNEDFGKYGWSFDTLENAMVKYNELK